MAFDIVIKQALAKTLVFYYPYAGRLIEGPGSRLMVYCNAQGVVFVKVDADVSLEELGDTILQPPCPYPELLPSDNPGSDGIIDSPSMLIQVMKVETLLNGRLHDVIKLVRETKKQVTKEYARSTIDYIAMNGREAKLMTPQNLVVSDTSKFGFDEVDFGWGKPSYAGLMDIVPSYNIAYSRVWNGDGEGVVVVPLALPATAMEVFENELKRLIWGKVSDMKSSVVCSKL